MFLEPDKLALLSIENFEIEPDLLILKRIEEVIARTKEYRNSSLETHEKTITQLGNELRNLKSEMELLTKVSGINYENLKKLGKGDQESDKDIGDKHIFAVMKEKATEMDHLKLTLAKNLNDLESQLNSLNIAKKNMLDKCNALSEEQENLTKEAMTKNPDSRAIRINIYRSLGIDLELAEYIDGADDRDRIVIYNKDTNLVNILNVEDKYSEYFITNYIWERLGGYD